MRAVLCEQLGDPSVLKIVDLPAPTPGKGEVLVRVRAAAMNFPDVLMVAGGYQHKPALPFTPGMEAAGEILALGDGVSGWSVGDKVIFGKRPGAFAEQVAVPVSGLAMKVPEGWSFAEGAAFRVGAQTAYHGVVHRAALKHGETLLVHGATGGVGLAAVQLGKHLGATVIATGGDDAKLEVVRTYGGADHVVNYRTGDFVAAVKEITKGRGADVIYDPVGGDVLEKSVRCAAFGGRLAVIGFTSGGPSKLMSNHILIKCLTVLGVRAGEAARYDPAYAEDYKVTMPKLAAQGVMRPHISHRLPMERVADAMRLLLDRKVVGKAVLEFS